MQSPPVPAEVIRGMEVERLPSHAPARNADAILESLGEIGAETETKESSAGAPPPEKEGATLFASHAPNLCLTRNSHS